MEKMVALEGGLYRNKSGMLHDPAKLLSSPGTAPKSPEISKVGKSKAYKFKYSTAVNMICFHSMASTSPYNFTLPGSDSVAGI